MKLTLVTLISHVTLVHLLLCWGSFAAFVSPVSTATEAERFGMFRPCCLQGWSPYWLACGRRSMACFTLKKLVGFGKGVTFFTFLSCDWCMQVTHLIYLRSCPEFRICSGNWPFPCLPAVPLHESLAEHFKVGWWRDWQAKAVVLKRDCRSTHLGASKNTMPGSHSQNLW